MLTPKQKRDLEKPHAAAIAYFRRLGKAGRKAHTAPASAARDAYWKRRKIEIAREKLVVATARVRELEAQQ
jgi:hypothetical protein